MKQEIILERIKRDLDNTDNYFQSEIDEILSIVNNRLKKQKNIYVPNIDILIYKFKRLRLLTYIKDLIKT